MIFFIIFLFFLSVFYSPSFTYCSATQLESCYVLGWRNSGQDPHYMCNSGMFRQDLSFIDSNGNPYRTSICRECASYTTPQPSYCNEGYTGLNDDNIVMGPQYIIPPAKIYSSVLLQDKRINCRLTVTNTMNSSFGNEVEGDYVGGCYTSVDGGYFMNKNTGPLDCSLVPGAQIPCPPPCARISYPIPCTTGSYQSNSWLCTVAKFPDLSTNLDADIDAGDPVDVICLPNTYDPSKNYNKPPDPRFPFVCYQISTGKILGPTKWPSGIYMVMNGAAIQQSPQNFFPFGITQDSLNQYSIGQQSSIDWGCPATQSCADSEPSIFYFKACTSDTNTITSTAVQSILNVYPPSLIASRYFSEVCEWVPIPFEVDYLQYSLAYNSYVSYAHFTEAYTSSPPVSAW